MSRTNRNCFNSSKNWSSPESNRQIFVQTLPVVGTVPIAFYIPEWSSKKDLIKLIEENGGIVLNCFEPFMYQIKPETLSSRCFYKADVYSSKLIKSSIKHGRMVNNVSNFKLGFNVKGREHDGISKKEYTYLEVLKIFEIVEHTPEPNKWIYETFWEKVESKCLIPGRTSKGLRMAYRKFIKMGKEEALQFILDKSEGRYSHSFKHPPNLNKEKTTEKTPTTQGGTDYANLSPVPAKLISDDENNNSDSDEENQEEEEKDDDIQEIILEVGDLESVVSYRETGDHAYNMRNMEKK